MEEQNKQTMEEQNKQTVEEEKVEEASMIKPEVAKQKVNKVPIFIGVGVAIIAVSLIAILGGGKSNGNENDPDKVPGSAHVHSYGEWDVTKQSTCTAKGSKERYCSCGEKQTESIEMLNHEFGAWKVVKEATCNAEGVKAQYCSCGESNTQPIVANTGHKDLETQIASSNFETSYSQLYNLYTSVKNHKENYGCNLDAKRLLESMLYGEWNDQNNNYISYTYIYSDYNNTKGSTWYGTNLPTSKVSGNTYYYYIETEGDDLIIGYQDKLTEDKTDNFVINFNSSGLSVYNKNNSTTYQLTIDTNYDKVQKGNAKLAYVYIAKKIFSFKYPGSVKVTVCHVDYETKTVYATIQATNGFGGTNNTDYKLYESNGRYYITEYSHNYSTNIDLTELNQKLQSYVASGG